MRWFGRIFLVFGFWLCLVLERAGELVRGGKESEFYVFGYRGNGRIGEKGNGIRILGV